MPEHEVAVINERCEPCSLYGVHVDAIGLMGWDNTPVCKWHQTNAWSVPAPIDKRG